MNELMNRLNLMDCMEGMGHFPDKFFELAIVDPPYGINICTEIDRSKFKENTSKNSMTKFEQNMKNKQWDNITPDKKYFACMPEDGPDNNRPEKK